MLNTIAKVAVGTVTYFVVSFALAYAFYDKIMAWSINAAIKMLGDIEEEK